MARKEGRVVSKNNYPPQHYILLNLDKLHINFNLFLYQNGICGLDSMARKCCTFLLGRLHVPESGSWFQYQVTCSTLPGWKGKRSKVHMLNNDRTIIK